MRDRLLQNRYLLHLSQFVLLVKLPVYICLIISSNVVAGCSAQHDDLSIE